jgi:hypothetical protein
MQPLAERAVVAVPLPRAWPLAVRVVVAVPPPWARGMAAPAAQQVAAGRAPTGRTAARPPPRERTRTLRAAWGDHGTLQHQCRRSRRPHCCPRRHRSPGGAAGRWPPCPPPRPGRPGSLAPPQAAWRASPSRAPPPRLAGGTTRGAAVWTIRGEGGEGPLTHVRVTAQLPGRCFLTRMARGTKRNGPALERPKTPAFAHTARSPESARPREESGTGRAADAAHRAKP